MGALFPQSLLCFSCFFSFHFKLLSQHMLLEKSTFFFSSCLSLSFAKDWLPLWLPSIFLGGSSGRGYRQAPSMGEEEDRKLCSVCHIWFSCSGQMSRAVRLFSTWRTEPAKPRLQYLLKTWLNISSHVKTIWQKLLYIFCTGEKKVMIIYSTWLRGHLLKFT